MFAYPSIYEGFGLPPLEAMAAGVPVVAARAASLPEVYGDAAHYCDPRDVGSIANVLRRAISDESLRQQLISKGLERARAFNWQRSADETLAVYAEAAGR